MSDCDCYNSIFNIVKKYAKSKAKQGESIVVGLHNRPYREEGCYISINYDTIRGTKHIHESEHLEPYFLEHTVSKKCVEVIIDDILEKFRRSKS
jgi:hypothetical protein